MKLYTLVLLALPLPAFAEAPHELPRKDDVLEVASAAAPLRESTPDALFGGKAHQIGWVKKGEAVKVLEARQYLSIFGLEIWLEVRKVDDPNSHGWVFDGMSAEILKGKASFSITQSAPQPEPAGHPADEAAKRADALVEDIN